MSEKEMKIEMVKIEPEVKVTKIPMEEIFGEEAGKPRPTSYTEKDMPYSDPSCLE